MMATPMKTLELHCPMNQFSIIKDRLETINILFDLLIPCILFLFLGAKNRVIEPMYTSRFTLGLLYRPNLGIAIC